MEQVINSSKAVHARYTVPTIIGNFDILGGEWFLEPHPSVIGAFVIELLDKMPAEQVVE